MPDPVIIANPGNGKKINLPSARESQAPDFGPLRGYNFQKSAAPLIK